MKGFYLAAIAQANMNILYISTFLPKTLTALKKFKVNPPSGLESLMHYDLDDLNLMEDKFYQLMEKTSLEQLDKIFLNIKVINGFLDFCMGLDYLRVARELNYDDKAADFELKNKESIPFFLNSIRCFKIAADQKKQDVPNSIKYVIGRKDEFKKFLNLNQYIQTTTESLFIVMDEPIRELTMEELNDQLIPFRDLWKENKNIC